MRLPTAEHLPGGVARFIVSLLAALLALAILAPSSAGAQEVRVQQQTGGEAAGRFPTAMVAYARGVAFAAKGRMDDAAKSLDSLRAIAAGVTTSPHTEVLQIATHALLGEIHARRGQFAGAVNHFRTAMRIEDGLSYMEPPYWHYAVRHSLGAALLGAGRPAEAELIYREDLKRFPDNGWSLHGLRQSLVAQRKTAEAADVARELDNAWGMADVKLAGSRF